MIPREIIAEAWTITRREKPLRRWGFFSSFFETLFLAKLLIYQGWFIWGYLQGRPVGFFDDVLWLYSNVSQTAFFSIIGTVLFLLCIEWVFPSLAKGAIIGLSAKAAKREELKGGPILAFYNFFPMFGFHEIFILGSLPNVVTLSSVVLRYVDGDVKFYIVGILAFFWLLSMILHFLASFAEPAMVVSRESIFSAIGTSFKFIVSYTGHILFLWLLLFVISIRIAINVVFALVIPATVIGVGFALINVLSPLATILIAAGIGVVLVLIASYFFAYLHVFKDAVWTITYLELKNQKDLTVID